MSIRRTDTEEARKFWDFVDRTSKHVREEFPSWARVPSREAERAKAEAGSTGCTVPEDDDDEDGD